MLADLRSLAGKPVSPKAIALLSKGLASKSNLLIAKAAEVAGQLQAKSLVDDLEKAFDRLLEHPTTTDKGCLAKTSIAKALHALEAAAERTFVSGSKVHQMEGTWGGSSDVAGELRGVCAMGLAQIGYRDALLVFADLLNDDDASVRANAARAIAASGREDGALLLRMKLLAGDRESDVLAECLTSLAQLSPVKSIEFLGRFLDSTDASVAASAALALGETRRQDAFEKLSDRWPHWGRSQNWEILLQAIALLRLPSAVTFLIERISEDPENVAGEALEAMRLYRNDSTVAAKIAAAVESRKSPPLQRKFEQVFRS